MMKWKEHELHSPNAEGKQHIQQHQYVGAQTQSNVAERHMLRNKMKRTLRELHSHIQEHQYSGVDSKSNVTERHMLHG